MERLSLALLIALAGSVALTAQSDTLAYVCYETRPILAPWRWVPDTDGGRWVRYVAHRKEPPDGRPTSN